MCGLILLYTNYRIAYYAKQFALVQPIVASWMAHKEGFKSYTSDLLSLQPPIQNIMFYLVTPIQRTPRYLVL